MEELATREMNDPVRDADCTSTQTVNNLRTNAQNQTEREKKRCLQQNTRGLLDWHELKLDSGPLGMARSMCSVESCIYLITMREFGLETTTRRAHEVTPPFQ